MDDNQVEAVHSTEAVHVNQNKLVQKHSLLFRRS